ncbi:MAG TPA: diaminopimelate epimerase [Acidimicrobiales bacterium]|nr:diaminopimelate epimerase [Acidimicrobiales bacterium]
MQLTKHHGLGNDFLVLLDLNPAGAIHFDADLARALCDRRRGIGADGLITVGPASGEADVTMGLRNADGSRAEMSGNGIRCLGQAVARARGHDTVDLVVGTDAGLRRLRVRPGPDAVTAAVEVDMGPAGPGPQLTALPGLVEATKAATVDMGNPHLVLLVEDPASVDLAALGPACQDGFDQGINVEVVAPVPGAADTFDLRVWERGVGITQACGTGACAAASAAHDWGVVGERVAVRMPGGAVEVTLGATVTLSGPAVFVAAIEVPG